MRWDEMVGGELPVGVAGDVAGGGGALGEGEVGGDGAVGDGGGAGDDVGGDVVDGLLMT